MNSICSPDPCQNLSPQMTPHSQSFVSILLRLKFHFTFCCCSESRWLTLDAITDIKTESIYECHLETNCRCLTIHRTKYTTHEIPKKKKHAIHHCYTAEGYTGSLSPKRSFFLLFFTSCNSHVFPLWLFEQYYYYHYLTCSSLLEKRDKETHGDHLKLNSAEIWQWWSGFYLSFNCLYRASCPGLLKQVCLFY